MPLACFHSSIAAFTHAGIGTVRMGPAFPTKSAMTQRSSRNSMASTRRASSSPRRSPHPISVARMAEFLYHGANSDPHTGQQSLALFCREPIPDSDSNPPHSLDSSNSGGEFRTEQTGISCLKSHPSDGRQPEVVVVAAYSFCSKKIL